MNIDIHIKAQNNWLGAGLAPTIDIMNRFKACASGPVNLVFSDTSFLYPSTLMSLIVFLARCDIKYSIANPTNYLKTIKFSEGGVRPEYLGADRFRKMMDKYTNKNYIPIINFSPSARTNEKEVVASVIELILTRQLQIKPNVANGLRYMISETIDNITEHSDSERAYIFAQSYPTQGFLDICIADNGITLLGSYRKLPNCDLSNDSEAIRAANQRISSKNLPEAENRGYGIYTTKRMLLEGLSGQYMMLSGSAMFIMGQGRNNYYTFPAGIRWEGTLVALRIPYKADNFLYTNYFE